MFNFGSRNHSTALTNEQIYKYAPSVFAVEAHESRSERFRPIPTIRVVEALRREGFEVVSARQNRAREDKRDFTKHLLRLRHVNDLTNTNRLSDSHAEIVLKNANDGTAAYELMPGLYRLLCSNGMIGWSPSFNSVKVRHSGNEENVARSVIEGTYTVVDESEKLLGKREQWGAITLGDDARLALAEAAHIIKFGDKDGNTDTPITPRQLLTIRRPGDAGKDLWSTFNVIQENSTRGGLRAYNTVTQRRMSTRDVNSLDVDVKINRALWKLTDFFASKVA